MKNITKKFKPQRKLKWLAILFLVVPFVPMLFGEPFDYRIIMNFITYSLIAIVLFIRYNNTIAEIKENKIYFYSGIGLFDPSELELSRINSVEKKAKKFLVFNYDENNKFSLEADKTVIDQIVTYLIN